MLKKVLGYTTAIGLVAGLAIAPGFAQDKPAPETNKIADEKLKQALEVLHIDLENIKPSTVVAKIGKKTITAEDVAKNMRSTAMMAQQALGTEAVQALGNEVLFWLTLENMIDSYLREQEVEANKARLEKDIKVQEQLAEARNLVLQEALTSEKVEQYITKERKAEKYKEVTEKYFPKDAEESHVRMIVVKDEDAAKKIIEQLNAGGDFLKLARENSIDKTSAANDGDMGYINSITKESLLPGFDIIFEKKNGNYTLATGSFSKTPIKSPMGFVILKVEDRRPVKKPKLSEIEDGIEKLLRQEALEKINAELKAKAEKNGEKIERIHPNTGKPMKALEEELKAIQEKMKESGIKDAAAKAETAAPAPEKTEEKK